MPETIAQRQWTETELRAAGFAYYERKKQLVMAGRLPHSAAPMAIQYPLEKIYAQAGDVIVYDPGDDVHESWRDYDYWSVKPDVFRMTYRRWPEAEWEPNPAQRHLYKINARPYYKVAGVWARRLTVPTYIKSIESPEPALIQPGNWVAVGAKGEPWYIEHAVFIDRYMIEENAAV